MYKHAHIGTTGMQGLLIKCITLAGEILCESCKTAATVKACSVLRDPAVQNKTIMHLR